MRTESRSLFAATAGALALAAALTTTGAALADDGLPLHLRANAGAQTRGRTAIVEISVTEWTTEEERQELLAYMQEEGTRSLAQKLQELSVKGSVAAAGQLGIDWRYAYQFEKAGGRTIVLGTDRPVNVGEAIGRGVVSQAHNITLALIELDDAGEGAGTLVLGAELAFGADGRLEVTGVGQNPVHLGNVRVLKKKKK